MASELQKQLAVGALVGALLSAAVFIILGGQREDLTSTEAQIQALEQENAKGRQLKANYQTIKTVVDQQTLQLNELIQIMPTDVDRGGLPMKFKKLADAAGIEQRSFKINAPKTSDYYIEHPYAFTYRAGFHGMGQFASLISGFGKLVNVKELHFKREGGNPIFPMVVDCTLSAYIYNPGAPPVNPKAKGPAGKSAAAKED